ncbi:hypothetical protein L2E82_15036 [Cichorium intybus]|uniref:Uncharacterized protein n=1 Tax=Cichorium intybus TaxID=13427 RepID=A0ACB9F1R4_CICIN|nr:hypothetical protein L2E82_15036 [Cichorium intybus]
MREELALKAAILAEKFVPDLSWYVDVILQLIDKAGDFFSDDIWFCVVQFVTNNEDIQSCIDAEIQQRAMEYFGLSRKGEALMDILAEMPKFPERQIIVYDHFKELFGLNVYDCVTLDTMRHGSA